MTEEIREQIMAIRDSGLTNIFDLNTVQRLANERDYFDLVLYIEDHKAQYVKFILTGHEE